MQAPKNGFFYVIDRTNGQLISAKAFAQVNWATDIDLKTGRPVEAPGARFKDPKVPFVSMPGPYGAQNWHPMSYSPQTGLVYIPVHDVPFVYLHDSQFEARPIGFNLGIDPLAVMSPDDPKVRAEALAMVRGYLKAWDPVTQTVSDGSRPNGSLDIQCLDACVNSFRPYTASRSLGATGFDVGCETPGACRVVSNSLNCLQTYSCKRRQLRSGGLIPPNPRPACACASGIEGRAHKLASPVCSRPAR